MGFGASEHERRQGHLPLHAPAKASLFLPPPLQSHHGAYRDLLPPPLPSSVAYLAGPALRFHSVARRPSTELKIISNKTGHAHTPYRNSQTLTPWLATTAFTTSLHQTAASHLSYLVIVGGSYPRGYVPVFAHATTQGRPDDIRDTHVHASVRLATLPRPRSNGLMISCVTATPQGGR